MQVTRRPGAVAGGYGRAKTDDEVKDGTAPGDVFTVHRVTFVTDIMDFNAIDMVAIIDQSLKAYIAIPGNGHIKTATLKTYQADDYAGATTPLILFSDKSFQRGGGRIRITHIIHSEPGEGEVRVVAVGRDWLLLLLVLVLLLLSRQRTSTALASRSNDVLPVSTPTCRISVIGPPAQSVARSRVLGGKRGRR